MNSKILVIDNYDSFTYNLVHLLHDLDQEVEVWRNDKFDLKDVDKFQKIILSPGPGIPEEAGLLLPLIKQYSVSKSIFGVCLGLQAIAESFGGTLFNLGKPMHGVATEIEVLNPDEIIFKNCPQNFKIGRYHSWVADADTLPEELEITAKDVEGQIMAIRHQKLDVRGVQFHPESVLTEYGLEMMKNWVFAK